jgi:ABC-type transport system involved in Fe-S cluster assembly fused permease/ATPase subunit
MYIINTDYWESIIFQNLFKRESEEFERMEKEIEKMKNENEEVFNKAKDENNFDNFDSNFEKMKSENEKNFKKIDEEHKREFEKDKDDLILGGFLFVYILLICLAISFIVGIIVYTKKSNKRKKAKYLELTKNNQAKESEVIKNYQNYVNSGISMTDAEKEEYAKNKLQTQLPVNNGPFVNTVTSQPTIPVVVGSTIPLMPNAPPAAAVAPGITNVPMPQYVSPVSPYLPQ